MDILDVVKKALRITNNAIDDEVMMLIEACYIDLQSSDVLINKETKNNELIKLAIINFVKANFGLDNKDSEKYNKIYTLLKIKLKIVGDDIVL